MISMEMVQMRLAPGMALVLMFVLLAQVADAKVEELSPKDFQVHVQTPDIWRFHFVCIPNVSIFGGKTPSSEGVEHRVLSHLL